MEIERDVMMFKSPPKTEELLKTAAPCVGEQMLVMLVNLASVAIIGHVGKNELTAVSMVNQLVNWLQFLFVGLSTGTTVVIARMWGVNDKDNVKKAYVQSLNVSVIIGIVLTILTLIFANFLINLFFGGAEEQVFNYLHIYFKYCMYGLPFMAILTLINASVRGTGDNKTPLVSTTILNLLNIILSYSFIYGIPILNIPKLGVVGAGIGVTSARILSCFILIIYIYIKKSPILPRKYTLKKNKEIISRIVGVGIPSSVEQLIFQGGFVILQSLLIPFGAAFQGGYQISGTINSISWCPANGIAVALTALTSQYISRKDYDGAKELVKSAKFIIGVTSGILMAVMIFGAPLFSKLFSTEADVIAVCTMFVRVFGSMVIPLGYSLILAGILRGAGDAKYIAVTCTLGMWLGRIMMVWALAKITGNGFIAVSVGVSSDFIVRAIMYHFRIKKGNWLYIKV